MGRVGRTGGRHYAPPLLSGRRAEASRFTAWPSATPRSQATTTPSPTACSGLSCHYFTEQMDLERSFFGVYKSVNEKFAAAAARAYTPGDTLWVQDYHLMLAPEMLRQRLPDARIGFFFHIPWPAEEVWRVLPWSRALTEGLLGADVIGFHTDEYVKNFLEAAARVSGRTRERKTG